MFTCIINDQLLTFPTRELRDQAVADAKLFPDEYTIGAIEDNVEETTTEGPDNDPDFQKDTTESAEVVSKDVAQKDMGLPSDDGSLDLVKNKPLDEINISELTNSPFYNKINDQDRLEVEDYITRDKQIKAIANDIQLDSQNAVATVTNGLGKTDYGSFDYTNQDIEELSNKATRNFIAEDEVIQKEIKPIIKKDLQPLLKNKIIETREKYGFDNPDNVTEEKLEAAEKELADWYNDRFSDEMMNNDGFVKRVEAFDLNKESLIGEDYKRFKSVNADGNAFEKGMDKFGLFLQDYSKSDLIGSDRIGNLATAYNSMRSLETGMVKAGVAADLQFDQAKVNSLQNNEKLAKKNNWTNETEGYWEMPSSNNSNKYNVFKFTPKYLKDLGYKDNDGTTTIAKSDDIFEGTWGEYQAMVGDVIKKDVKEFGKKLVEVQNEEVRESLFADQSWEKILDGDLSLNNFINVTLKQAPQFLLAASPIGWASSGAQIGADIYFDGIENEAIRRFNVPKGIKPTPEMYAEVVADDKFMKTFTLKVAGGGVLAGGLDKLGASRTLKLFAKTSTGALLRGGAKDFFKRGVNFAGENLKAAWTEVITEISQEVIQAGASSSEITGEQIFAAGGQAFISTLMMGSGGKIMTKTMPELKASYSILSGKLNKNSSEAFFNQELQKIDLAKNNTKDKNEIKDLEDKAEQIKEFKEANLRIPKGVEGAKKQELVDNLVEMFQIDKVIKDAGPILGPVIKEDLSPRLEELKEKTQAIITTEKTLGKFKSLAKDFKLGVTETDQKGADEIRAKAKNLDKVIHDSAGYGLIYTDENGKTQVVLNKEAIYEDGMINTGAHEFLHYAVSQGLKSSKDIKAISDSLMDLLENSEITGDKSQYDARVKQYKADLDKKKISAEDFAEEKLVLLSEALLNGDFKINEGFTAKLADIVRRLLSTIGVRAEFNNSQDVLNFVKDYNRSMTKGKLSLGQKRTIRKGAKGSMITPNVVNKATQKIKDPKATPKPNLKDSKTLTLEQLKEKAEDLLEESNLDSSNQALLDRYYDTMDAIDAMEDTELNESTPIAKQEEKKQIAKDDTPQVPREKKDRSTKRYTLTDEQKAEIEPLIAKAQILNKELIAKEKAATDARIKKITDKSERQMSRTDQAKAIADIKANPTRYSKSAELTNLENKIQEKVKVPLTKLINAYTKRLYDGIPAQAKEIVSREDYQTEARAVVVTTLINEFKKNTTNRLGEKTTNDIEDLMFNRGYFRMLPLATAMGVSSKVEGIAQRFDNVANNIGTEDIMFDEKTNEPEMIMEGKFKISSLLASIDRYKQAMAAAIAFWKENEGNSPIENFKNLPGFTAEILGEMFGIPAKIFDKRLSRSPNLNNKVYKSAMDAITKPYAVFKITRNGVVVEERVEVSEEKAFAKKLTEDGFEFEQLANQNILQTLFKFLPQLSAEDYNYAINNAAGRSKGKSTGVPKNIMKLAFTNKQRRTTGTGNVSGDLRRLSYKEVLDGIGGFINEKGEAQVKMGIDAKSPEGQTFIGVMRVLNRMVANELSRSSLIGLDPMTVKDIAAGKNDLMESKRKKVLNQKSVIEVIKINEFIKDTATNDEINYLQGKLNKFFVESKGKATVIKQIKFASNLAKKKWGNFGKGLFNNEFKYNLEKLSAKDRKEFGLDDISKALGKAWGRTFNYIVRFKGLEKELDQLNEDSTKEDIETFILVFGRSLKNSKYEGTDRKAITTNKSLFEEINQRLGDDQSLKNLGFELDIVPIRNKDGKIVGERSFIYDISSEERRLVNPALTVLDIKNKAFKSMGVIGPQVLDISDLYRNAIKRVLKKYKASGDIEGGKAVIEAMFFGQVSAGRRIATLRKAYNFKGKATLEHVTSVDLTKPILREFLEGGSETVYDAKLDKLFVDVIPADLDKLLRKVGLEGRYDAKVKYKGKWTTVNKELAKLDDLAVFDVVKARENNKQSKRSKNAVKAVSLANNAKTPVKGISVWDFDDTLAKTKSNVLYTMPNGTKGKLTAEEFAKTGDRLANEGAVYDFSEFSKVMNGKKGPMFAEAMARNKKFGNKNVYILTARPANSATAIHAFLKGLGLNIPVENITGLANSSPLAKADWVVEKAAEGYNDFYFADDHIGNVKAVQEVLNVLDVKGKVHQAKVKESKKLDSQFNKFLEGSTGIESFKRYKSDKAKLKGRYKGKLDVFIPPSAEDFLGLLYQTLNKGKRGEAQMKFYEDNLLKPYAKANSALRTARVRSVREFDAIKKKLKIVPKDLKRSFKVEDENGNIKDSLFTKEQAIRVYIWNSQGIEMPNLSQVDLAVMVNEVNANPELKAFADELLKLNRGVDSKAPSKNWMDGNIGIDLQANLNSVGRKQLLEVWQQNVDEIFSETNLNKLEAAYGPEYVKALESSLRRMRTGRSAAPVTDNEAGNNLIMWLNSAVGNIMFFNDRSALLQMLSATNFLNFEENNIIAAGKAFANQPQYWKDFTLLINSDYLVDRRDGTRININEADIALIAKQSGFTGVIAKVLELGFLPTKIMDSVAIATGGATYYRTKVNALIKSGMSKAKAEAQAMQEFTSIAEVSQQSSDQSKLSMEQAGSVGKIILAFNNTSSQYSRIIKRSVQDLYNRRGSDKANIARIVYYGGMQNLVFNFMQQAMFAALWGGEDDEEVLDGKKAKVVNSMADGLLRGMGVKAAIFVAVKNTAIKLYERSKKDVNKDYRYYAITGMLAVSPPLSSKVSKLSKAASAYQYGTDKMKYGKFSLDSPELEIGANMVSFATSLPTDRLLTKVINVSDALDASNEPWERLFMLMGWPKWTMQSKSESDLERKEDKDEIKEIKSKAEFDAMTPLEQKTEALEDLKKFQQVDSLKAYGLTDKEIRDLKYEKDRVNKILSLEGSEKKDRITTPEDAISEELFDLKKQQQVDSLTKYGLTKKQIRALKYEKDRVDAIIKYQNKRKKEKLKNSLK